jgi:hypothetical protein
VKTGDSAGHPLSDRRSFHEEKGQERRQGRQKGQVAFFRLRIEGAAVQQRPYFF